MATLCIIYTNSKQFKEKRIAGDFQLPEFTGNISKRGRKVES
jgi:hypothetical protein